MASDVLTWSCWRLWAPLEGKKMAEETAAHHSFGTPFLLTSVEIQSGTAGTYVALKSALSSLCVTR